MGKLRHILTATDFTPAFLDYLYGLALDIKRHPEEFRDSLRGRRLTRLFMENSTRTAESFLSAAQDLGCNVNGFTNISGTSVEKGETLRDTALMYSGWGTNTIVIRSPWAGAPRQIAKVMDDFSLDIPVVSGGDDSRGHPTQALLDVFTMWETSRDGSNNNVNVSDTLRGIKVACLGDHKFGRTVPSLVYTLGSVVPDCSFYFIGPEELQVSKRPEVLEFLKSIGINYELHSNLFTDELRTFLRDEKPDFLYVTRVQKERMKGIPQQELRSVYVVDGGLLRLASQDLKVMHPLPRIDELAEELDQTGRQLYLEQARNGLFVRKALLLYLMQRHRPTFSTPERVLIDSSMIENGQHYERCMSVHKDERQRSYPVYQRLGDYAQCIYCGGITELPRD